MKHPSSARQKKALRVQPTDGTTHIELAFSPDAKLVSIARRFISELFERTLKDPELTSRLALTIHELLENAVKYSIDGWTELRIDVTKKDRENHIKIRMMNRADPADIATLTGLLSEMATFERASDFYHLLTKKNARKKEGSGLGLARIWAEAETNLSYAIEGDRVCIIAEIQT